MNVFRLVQAEESNSELVEDKLNSLVRNVRRLSVLQKIKSLIANLKMSIVLRSVPELRVFEASRRQDEDEPEGLDNSDVKVAVLLGIIMVANLVEVFVQTLNMCYDAQISTLNYIYQLPFIFFGFLNIILNFFIFREKEGLTLTKLREIRQAYLSYELWLDVATLTLQILNCFQLHVAVVVLLFLLKTVQLAQSSRVFEQVAIRTVGQEQVWRLVFLLFFNIFIANIIAIIFNLMSNVNTSANWQTKFNISKEIWYVRYCWTIYWSVTTMMTVGYGDITPGNYQEALVVATCELVGGIIYVYNINTIGNVLNDFYSSKLTLNKDLRIMRNFFRREKKKSLTARMKNKILNNIRNQASVSDAYDLEQEEALISRLQPKLNSKLRLDLRTNLLFKDGFFKNLSRELKKEMSLRLKKEFFFNNEHITLARKLNDRVFILERGKAVCCITNHEEDVPVEEYQGSEETPFCFGLRSLIGRLPEQFNTKLEGVCQLYSISNQEFITLLNLNKADKEKFFYDQARSSPSYFPYDKFCELCKMKQHSIATCPRYHYYSNKFILHCRQSLRSNPRAPLARSRSRKATTFRNGVSQELIDIYTFNNCLDEKQSFEEDVRDTIMNIQVFNRRRQHRETTIGGVEPLSIKFQRVSEYRYYFWKENISSLSQTMNKKADDRALSVTTAVFQ